MWDSSCAPLENSTQPILQSRTDRFKPLLYSHWLWSQALSACQAKNELLVLPRLTWQQRLLAVLLGVGCLWIEECTAFPLSWLYLPLVAYRCRWEIRTRIPAGLDVFLLVVVAALFLFYLLAVPTNLVYGTTLLIARSAVVHHLLRFRRSLIVSVGIAIAVELGSLLLGAGAAKQHSEATRWRTLLVLVGTVQLAVATLAGILYASRLWIAEIGREASAAPRAASLQLSWDAHQLRISWEPGPEPADEYHVEINNRFVASTRSPYVTIENIKQGQTLCVRVFSIYGGRTWYASEPAFLRQTSRRKSAPATQGCSLGALTAPPTAIENSMVEPVAEEATEMEKELDRLQSAVHLLQHHKAEEEASRAQEQASIEREIADLRAKEESQSAEQKAKDRPSGLKDLDAKRKQLEEERSSLEKRILVEGEHSIEIRASLRNRADAIARVASECLRYESREDAAQLARNRKLDEKLEELQSEIAHRSRGIEQVRREIFDMKQQEAIYRATADRLYIHNQEKEKKFATATKRQHSMPFQEPACSNNNATAPYRYANTTLGLPERAKNPNHGRFSNRKIQDPFLTGNRSRSFGATWLTTPIQSGTSLTSFPSASTSSYTSNSAYFASRARSWGTRSYEALLPAGPLGQTPVPAPAPQQPPFSFWSQPKESSFFSKSPSKSLAL